MSRCYRCGQDRPEDAFIRRADEGRDRMCRACVSEILLTRSPRRGRLPLTDTVTDAERTCYLCMRVMPVAAFRRRSSGAYSSACRDCFSHYFTALLKAEDAAVGATYTNAEWQSLVALYERCPRCRRRWGEIQPPARGRPVITVGHIIPISKGGRNVIANLQPLCYTCKLKEGGRARRPRGARPMNRR